MSGKHENMRKLNQEETAMVNGGDQPEKEALPDPFGTEQGNQTEQIDPLNNWTPSGIRVKCVHCGYETDSNHAAIIGACPKCHQPGKWSVISINLV